MNKVFKTVWNASLGAWVAVSEIEGARGKSVRSSTSSSTLRTVPPRQSGGRFYMTVLATGLYFALQPGLAAAALPVYKQSEDKVCFFDKSRKGIVCGLEADIPDNPESHAIAVGDGARAHAMEAISIGTNSQAKNRGDIVIGPGAYSGTGHRRFEHNTVVGAASFVEGLGHSVLGADNVVQVFSTDPETMWGSVAVGRFNRVFAGNSSVIGDHNAVGLENAGENLSYGSHVQGNQNVVRNGSFESGIFGSNNTIDNSANSTVIGRRNMLTDSQANTVTGRFNTVQSSSVNTVNGSDNRLTNVIGTLKQDGHIETSNSVIGAGNNLDTIQGSGFIVGDRNTVTARKDDGTTAAQAGFSSIEVVGSNNSLKAADAGTRTRISVLGSENTLYGNGTDAIVAGSKNSLRGTFTGAQLLGTDIAASGDVRESVAVGKSVQLSASKSVAIGSGTQVSTGNSVALGAGSVANADSTAVSSAAIGGITYGGFSGVAQPGNGIVSIGAAGKERQLTNVAAGRVTANSTDAINGSQLFATNTVVSNVARSASRILGGNATVNATTGVLSMSNIGGTGKNTVHEAIAEGLRRQPVVAQGYGISVTSAITDNKAKYTVALSNATKADIAAGKNAAQYTFTSGNTNLLTVENDTARKNYRFTPVTGNVANGATGLVTGGAVHNAIVKATASANLDGLTFSGNSGTTGKKKLGSAIAVTGKAGSGLSSQAAASGIVFDLNAQTVAGNIVNLGENNPFANKDLSNLTEDAKNSLAAELGDQFARADASNVGNNKAAWTTALGDNLAADATGLAKASDVFTSIENVKANVLAKQPVVAQGDGIAVTSATVDDKTTYTVALNDATKADIATAKDAAAYTFTSGDQNLVTIEKDEGSKQYRFTPVTGDVADGATGLVTGGDVFTAISDATASANLDGLTLTGNNGTTGEKKLGSTLAVAGKAGSGLSSEATDAGIVFDLNAQTVAGNIVNLGEDNPFANKDLSNLSDDAKNSLAAELGDQFATANASNVGNNKADWANTLGDNLAADATGLAKASDVFTSIENVKTNVLAKQPVVEQGDGIAVTSATVDDKTTYTVALNEATKADIAAGKDAAAYTFTSGDQNLVTVEKDEGSKQYRFTPVTGDVADGATGLVTGGDVFTAISEATTSANLDGLTLTGNNGTTGEKKLGSTLAVTGKAGSGLSSEATDDGVVFDLNAQTVAGNIVNLGENNPFANKDLSNLSDGAKDNLSTQLGDQFAKVDASNVGNNKADWTSALGDNLAADATGLAKASDVFTSIENVKANALAKQPVVEQGDGIAVTSATVDDKTTYTVALNGATKADIAAGKDAAAYTFASGDQNLVTVEKDEGNKQYRFTPVTGDVADGATGLVTGGSVFTAISNATASANLDGLTFSGNNGTTGEKKLGSAISVAGKDGSGLSSEATDAGIVFDLNAQTVAENIASLGDNNPFANKDLSNLSDSAKDSLASELGDQFAKFDGSNVSNNKADWANALGDNIASDATGLAKAGDVHHAIVEATKSTALDGLTFTGNQGTTGEKKLSSSIGVTGKDGSGLSSEATDAGIVFDLNAQTVAGNIVNLGENNPFANKDLSNLSEGAKDSLTTQLDDQFAKVDGSNIGSNKSDWANALGDNLAADATGLAKASDVFTSIENVKTNALAKQPVVEQGDGIAVTSATVDDKTTYTVALNDATKADIAAGKDAASYTFTSGDQNLMTVEKDADTKQYRITPVTGDVANGAQGLVTGGDVFTAISEATASGNLDGLIFSGNNGTTGEKKLGSAISMTGKDGSGLSSEATDAGIVFDLNAQTVAENIAGLGDNNPFANKDLSNLSEGAKDSLTTQLGDQFAKVDGSNIGNNKSDWANALGDTLAADATGLAKASDVFTSIENVKTSALAKQPVVEQGDGIAVTSATVDDKTTYTIALNDATKADIAAGKDAAAYTFTSGDQKLMTVEKDEDTKQYRITPITGDVANGATGLVTGGEVFTAISEATASANLDGLTFSGNNGTTGEKKLGSAISMTGKDGSGLSSEATDSGIVFDLNAQTVAGNIVNLGENNPFANKDLSNLSDGAKDNLTTKLGDQFAKIDASNLSSNKSDWANALGDNLAADATGLAKASDVYTSIENVKTNALAKQPVVEQGDGIAVISATADDKTTYTVALNEATKADIAAGKEAASYTFTSGDENLVTIEKDESSKQYRFTPVTGDVADGATGLVTGGDVFTAISDATASANLDGLTLTGNNGTTGEKKLSSTVAITGKDGSGISSEATDAGIVFDLNAQTVAGNIVNLGEDNPFANKDLSNLSDGAKENLTTQLGDQFARVDGSNISSNKSDWANALGDNLAADATGLAKASDVFTSIENVKANALAKQPVIEQGDGIAVTSATADDKTTYTVALSDAAKADIAAGKDAASYTFTSGDQNLVTVEKDENTKEYRFTPVTGDVANGATGLVTGGDVHNAIVEATKSTALDGLTFTGNEGTTGEKKLGSNIGVTGKDGSGLTSEATDAGIVFDLNAQTVAGNIVKLGEDNPFADKNLSNLSEGAKDNLTTQLGDQFAKVDASNISSNKSDWTNALGDNLAADATGLAKASDVYTSIENVKTTALAKQPVVEQGDGIAVTSATVDDKTTYTVALNEATKADIAAGKDAASYTFTSGNQNLMTVEKDENTKQYRITPVTGDVANGATGLVTGGDVHNAIVEATASANLDGLTFTGDHGTTGEKKLGSSIAVTGKAGSGLSSEATDAGIVFDLNAQTVAGNIVNLGDDNPFAKKDLSNLSDDAKDNLVGTLGDQFAKVNASNVSGNKADWANALGDNLAADATGLAKASDVFTSIENVKTTALAKQPVVEQGDGIAVTSATADDKTTYTVALSDATKADIAAGKDAASYTFTSGDQNLVSVVKDEDTKQYRITPVTGDVANGATGLVTGGDVFTAISEATASGNLEGLTFTGNNGTTGEKKLGSTLAVTGKDGSGLSSEATDTGIVFDLDAQTVAGNIVNLGEKNPFANKDLSNLSDSAKGNLVGTLGDQFAKVDGSNIGSNKSDWANALGDNLAADATGLAKASDVFTSIENVKTTALAKQPVVEQGDGIAVTSAIADDKTTYTVALNDATKADIAAGKDAASYTFTSGDENLVTIEKDESNKQYRFTPVTGDVAKDATGLVTGGDVYTAISEATTSGNLDGLTFTGNSGTTGEKKLSSIVAITGKDGSGISSEATDAGIVFDLNAQTVAGNIVNLGEDNPFVNKDLSNLSEGARDNLTTQLGDQFAKVDASNISSNKSDWVNALGDELAADATGLAKASDVFGMMDKGIVVGDGNKSNKFALGDTINIKGDSNVLSTASADGVQLSLANMVTIGKANPIAINGDSGTISGLTNTTFDASATYTGGVAATQEQLQSAFSSVSNVAGRGWNLTVNGKDSSNVAPGATVDFASGNNIVINKSGDTVTVGLASELALDSVKTGNATLDTNGLTIAGGPSVTSKGIDAGNRKITNVAAGTELTDAVNLGQLNAVKNLANAGWNIGDASGMVGNVAPGAQVNFVAGNGNTKVNVTQENGATQVQVSAAPSAIQYTDTNNAAGGNAPSGDQFKPTNQVTLVGADSNAPVTLNNVADAQLSGDSLQAANGRQVFELGESIASGLGGASVFNPKTGRVETSLDINGNKYTSVSDALSSLGQVASAGWKLQVDGDTPTAVAPSSTVGFNGGNNIVLERRGNDITVSTAKDVTFNSVKADVVSAKDVKVSESIGVIDGPSMNRDGIDAGGKPISNVGPGARASDVATVGQVARGLSQLSGQVERYKRDADGGTAAAMATAGLPQAYLPGKSMFAISGSTFQGQGGYAAGLSTVSANGSWVIKGSVSGSSRGQVGGTVGVGYQW